FHELTHGFTQFTAKLSKGEESGALNESNSDMFAMAILHKWTNGVGNKVFRDAANPTSIGEPDKLFSANWKCGGDIHKNGTVFSHTLFLIGQGGSANGCTITGIGQD